MRLMIDLRTGEPVITPNGDLREIRKKKKRAGETFEKFCGKKTPEACGPEELLATQVRILQYMLSFLTQIHK